jgi:ribosome modulation factor
MAANRSIGYQRNTQPVSELAILNAMAVGRRACARGQSRNNCPYGHWQKAVAWIAGWDAQHKKQAHKAVRAMNRGLDRLESALKNR